MILNATEVAPGEKLKADICVIGAGPAGLVVADRLAQSGMDVVVCEGGGLEWSESSQNLYAGETDGPVDFDIRDARLRYFGGTSNHWGGQVGPMDSIDLEHRSWVPDSGWPISQGELEPYYDEARREFGLDEQSVYELDADERQSNTVLETSELGITNKLRRVVTPATRFGAKYRKAFQSARHIKTILNATVTGFEVSPDRSHILHAKVKSPALSEFVVLAKSFVIASGGIENARLLLQPTRQSPVGIGNETGMVGRYFQFHPRTRDAAFVLSVTDARRFRPYRRYASEAGRAHLLWGFTDRIQASRRLLNGCFLPNVADVSDLHEHVDSASTRAIESLVALHRGSIEEPVVVSLRLLVEQAPNPDSRVVLTSERDAMGMLRPRVEWRLSELDKASYRRSCEVLGRAVAATKLGRLAVPSGFHKESWDDTTFSSYHHMGATRMGTDRRTSVVDANCKVHSVDNLYIAGSSVFPTSGWVNPTYTIVALSVRLAGHLGSHLNS